jgi:hypothetical protein
MVSAGHIFVTRLTHSNRLPTSFDHCTELLKSFRNKSSPSQMHPELLKLAVINHERLVLPFAIIHEDYFLNCIN